MDPLLVWLSHLFVGGLLIAAAVHKLADRRRFAQALLGYRVLPPAGIAAASVTVPLLESVAGVASLVGPSRLGNAGLLAASFILCAYACLILFSLARGIRFIDCGCLGIAGRRQGLHPAMALRNIVIAGFGALGLIPGSGRVMHWLDGLSILAALSIMSVLYAILEFTMSFSKRELIR
jgi:hypothetical protein